MITTIDEVARKVRVVRDGVETTYDLASKEGFEAASQAWLRAGWDTKYVYSFSWFGRPIIQLPEDLIRIQEVVYSVKPDLVIETGVAHGGSLIFYASLLRAMGGEGRVIGIDVDIRAHNRQAIEAHDLFPLITLIQGSSTDPATATEVRSHVKPGARVLVILDSNHTYEHVSRELEIYSEFVSVDSYIVVADGIMQDLVGAPRSESDWASNNPRQALLRFAETNPDFVLEEPRWPFNESQISARVTYWPDAYLRRVSR